MLPLVGVTVLAPLLIAPGLFFYYDVTPKLLVLFFCAAAACLWWARSPDKPGGRASRWWAGLLAAQGVSLAVSTWMSAAPAISLGGSNWRRFGALAQIGLLIFAFLAARRQHARPLLRAVAGAGILAAAYAVLQYFGWDPWLPPASYHAGEGAWIIVRPPGTLGHAAYLGTYCVFASLAGAGLSLTEAGRFWRALGVAAMALGGAATVLSGTRAAVLGLLAGFVFLGFRLRLRAVWRGLAAAVVVAALFVISPAGARLRSRAHWISEDPAGGARLLLWRDSLRLCAARWMTGYGPETFPLVFPRYQSAELARAYPDFYQESPHNIFLDALVAQGVPGVALLAAICVLGFRAAKSRLSAALAAALAGGLVSQQFSAFILPTALCFYLCVGLLVALDDAEPAAVRHRWWPAAAALPMAAGLVFCAVQLALYDRMLNGIRRALEAGQAGSAMRPRALTGEGADLWYSRKLPPASQAALEAAVRATHTAADRQNAWYNLAMYQALRNDARGTESSLRAAIACAPRWFKPHWALARLLAREGRAAEASAEAALALQFGGYKYSEVRRTLEGL